MPGQWITLEAADGSGSFRAYLATPASGGGPGLVLAQEIFGVNGTMRDVADYYAEEGYVVLVPDLFWRQEPAVELDAAKDMPRAFALYQGFDEAKGLQDLQTAISALRARPEVRTQGGKVGVLGFCGVGIEAALAEAADIQCRLVLHIAELDGFCPPPAREAIVQTLSGRENVELYIYPGTDHAFARVGGDHFHKPSALMAHQRSVAALRRAIGATLRPLGPVGQTLRI